MLYQKDFELIATILATISNVPDRTRVARQFAQWLATKNPSFKKHRFLVACGAVEAKVDNRQD